MEWDQHGELDSAVQLGRYTLLTKIAEGQLTTVYLARQQSAAGFTRLVALKRLRPDLAHEREYVDLLQDEAHIGAGLNHANLVAAIDVGGSAHECFVAYEYVEGDSLAGLLARPDVVRHPRFLAPLFVDVLSGLDAAHNALGPGDMPIQLVHQAPRAEHILVGIDGIARIADFGQVRSPALRPNRLRTDRLKIGYMAPEQVLRPDLVDHRADIFILGITFWETLTGRRLFESYSEEQSFQNLLHREIHAPSEVNRALPACFDDICLRALDREPEQRYESAADMARELRDTAINHALFATAPEVGQWVKALCGSELIARRRLAGSESPSQQMRVPEGGGRRRIAPFVEEPSRVDALPEPPAHDEDSVATTLQIDELSEITTPAFEEEEVTTLHLAPSDDPDDDEVPILMDEFAEHGEGRGADSLFDESVVAPLAVPEGYDRNPDSGELPDFSDPDHDAPTRVFEGVEAREDVVPADSAGAAQNEIPTRVMPAPSERASAFAREHVARSRPPAAADDDEQATTPAYGTSLWMPEQRGSEPPAPPGAASRSTPPPGARSRAPRRDYREENLPYAERRDSTPTRMRLSSGPVGDVFGSSAPPPAAPAEPPAAGAVPPAPPAPEGWPPASAPSAPSTRAAGLAPPPLEELPFGPPGESAAMAPGALPDSLTPPSQAHTLPPDETLQPRRGRTAKRVAIGFVAIAAALAVAWGLTQRSGQPSSAASPPERLDDPDFVAAPEQGTPADERAPSERVEQAAQEIDADELADTAEQEQEHAQAPDAAARQSAQGDAVESASRTRSGTGGKPRRAATRSKPSRPAGARSAGRPRRARPKAAQGSRPPARAETQGSQRGPDWRSRGEEIPENPF